jgi:hypothetical protein
VGFVLQACGSWKWGRAFVIRKPAHLKIFKTVTSGSLGEGLCAKWMQIHTAKSGK